jgi:endonuclease/exonuclease/phosphatase family metal-dependent hydrolase
MTYNINWDAIFPSGDPKSHSFREFDLGPEFSRVMRAINPDVLCLQEIHHIRTEVELSTFLSEIMDDDRAWQIANVRDNVIATHFNLVEEGYELYTRGIRPSMAQAAAFVDLPDAHYGANDLYVICAHFKSAGGIGDIKERGRQADVIMRQVRDLKTSGDNIDLLPNTPFIILGDFNVYDTDPAEHLNTLLSGDIQFEDSYGEDVSPDWDDSSLEDAFPSHNGQGIDFYTWRADSSPFNPGPLDRIIYSDSVLVVENSFILNTTLLTSEALDALGLQRYDVMLDVSSGYYDHLPIVVDFLFLDEP